MINNQKSSTVLETVEGSKNWKVIMTMKYFSLK